MLYDLRAKRGIVTETPATYDTRTPIVPDDSPAIAFNRSIHEPLVSVVLPVKLTNKNHGTNSWYRTRTDLEQFKSELSEMKRKPFEHKVWLRITRILGKGHSFWDSDSGLRGNSKELIDALVWAGWFYDDCPKWITETRFAQDATQRKNGPAVKVEVFTAGP